MVPEETHEPDTEKHDETVRPVNVESVRHRRKPEQRSRSKRVDDESDRSCDYGIPKQSPNQRFGHAYFPQ